MGVLKIPDGTISINDNEFQNRLDIEEVIIPESITFIGVQAFSGCSNLKKVILPNTLKFIHDRAFENCINLGEINLPENLTYLGIFAFANSGIRNLFIPKNLETIELGAFAFMRNLKTIEVDNENPYFLSQKSLALVKRDSNVLIQYAINAPNIEYTVGPYQILKDYIHNINEIAGIDEYAFAGAKNLMTLNINATLDFIGATTFLDCDKLKTLNIAHCSFGDAWNQFNAGGDCPFNDNLLLLVHPSNSNQKYPFKNLYIKDDILTIGRKCFYSFNELETVVLPNTIKQIDEAAFLNSSKIKEIYIPNTIEVIAPNTFHPNIALNFFYDCYRSLYIQASEFETLWTKNGIRVLALKDGTYYVDSSTLNPIKITKEEIAYFSKNSNLLENSPDKFAEYLMDLFKNCESSNYLQRYYVDDNFKIVVDKFLENFDDVEGLFKIKIEKLLNHAKQEAKNGESLLDGILMLKLDKENAEILIKNLDEYVDAFLRNTVLNANFNPNSKYKILESAKVIVHYCKTLKKYGIRDRFLYDATFPLALSEEEVELFLSNFNTNIKRLIKTSKVLEKPKSSVENFSNLFTLCKILGCFEKDEIQKQRACTYITEKVLSPSLFQICGDDIHRIFDNIFPRKEFDSEFASLFFENYKELFNEEIRRSGFIKRIYSKFPDISKTSTSNQGEQRHLKVTLQKCRAFFTPTKFKNINDENRHIAEAIGEWFDSDEAFDNSIHILKESKKAPRNIFDPNYPVDGLMTNNYIAYHDSRTDLKEQKNGVDFTYEWLYKQSVENLLLGKYCNCCAHVNANGAGIMRASMISPHCQTLIIRDPLGAIVSKATVYVNRLKGYAVFNTIETSLLYSKNKQALEQIYAAFIRGTKTFVETYNKNYPMFEIRKVTVGEKRNTLIDIMNEKDIHSHTESCDSIDYSDFEYNGYGKYKGDARDGQMLVLKK